MRKLPFAVLIILIILLLVSACRGKSTSNPTETSVGAPVDQEHRPEAAKKQPRPVDGPVAQPKAWEQTRLLPAAPFSRLLAEDFVVGPLQDRLEGERERLEASRAASGLLESFSQGRVEASLILEPFRRELTRSLSRAIAARLVPDGFRIAVSQALGGDVQYFRARLKRGNSMAAAEIACQKEGGQWKVAELQADFSALQRERPRSEEKFRPPRYPGQGEERDSQ